MRSEKNNRFWMRSEKKNERTLLANSICFTSSSDDALRWRCDHNGNGGWKQGSYLLHSRFASVS